MKLKKSELQHIQNAGERWHKAIMAASLSVRQNPKLIGLDKIREMIAICAALKATGCPSHEGFVMPREVGDPILEMQQITSDAFTRAVASAESILMDIADYPNLEDV